MTKQMSEILAELAKLNGHLSGQTNGLRPEDTTPEIARQLPEFKDATLSVIHHHLAHRIVGVVESVKAISHMLIPTQHGDLLARIYKPTNDPRLPVLLYFHGGGFVLGNLNSFDSSCRSLANAAGCIVVSVAYRQAPEHRYPAAHEDALASYEWALRNANLFGGDRTRIAVGGECAGANLAASLCLQARELGLPTPAHQLLLYPWLDSDFTRESHEANEFAKPLNLRMLKWFSRHYFGANLPVNDPVAFPLQAESFQRLPAATIITAELDPLCDEGQEYAEHLFAAGVSVLHKKFDGVTHEFFSANAVLDEARAALRMVADQLQTSFSPDEIFENATPAEALTIQSWTTF